MPLWSLRVAIPRPQRRRRFHTTVHTHRQRICRPRLRAWVSQRHDLRVGHRQGREHRNNTTRLGASGNIDTTLFLIVLPLRGGV